VTENTDLQLRLRAEEADVLSHTHVCEETKTHFEWRVQLLAFLFRPYL
jgi:hypothetical protein